MNINAFFTHVLGAHLKNIRWSWGAVDTFSDRVYLRIWRDQFEQGPAGERVQIGYPKGIRRSAGFGERDQQIALIQSGAEGFGVVCTAVDPDVKGSRTIKSFDDRTLVCFGRIVREGEHTYAEIAGRVSVSELSRPKTSESSLSQDLRAIARRPIDATQKEVLINARVGQGRFRADVLRHWGNGCAVTGSVVPDAIRASHIKPWRDCSDEERLDPANGLPLIANLDALFDAGLISFDASGSMLVSEALNGPEKEILLCGGRRLLKPPAADTKRYLEYHRHHIYQAARARALRSQDTSLERSNLALPA